MRARGWIRAGLVVLAAVHTAVGVWTLFLGQSFYDLVPTVDLFPPFNQHLFADYGGLNLALAVVVGSAAVLMDVRVVRVALAAEVVTTVIHLVFHATHLVGFTAGQAAFELSGLAVWAALPATLWVLTWLRPTITR